MKDLARYALERATAAGASYADIRCEHITKQILSMANGTPGGDGHTDSSGIAVRVIMGSGWGFAACHGFTREATDHAVDTAIATAKAAAAVNSEPIVLAPAPAITASYRTPVQIDPFSVPVEDKLALLSSCDQAMIRDGVSARLSRLEFVRKDKFLLTSEGTEINQSIIYSGVGIAAVAAGGGDVQIRSYPHCWQNGGQFATRGYELVLELEPEQHAGRIAAEAVQLLSAEPCPSGTFDLILDPTQLALQIHESCGHPVELDRVLGSEASLAGTSFLTVDKMGSFPYGSELVTLTADATIPGALGTFGYDDEGIPAGSVTLVDRGVFAGYLTSRESAARIGQTSNGAMRADSWHRLPLIRMTNINLTPHQGSLQDLIADTPVGLFMTTIRSWSIDDLRLNFQFGCEAAYEINNGRLGKMLKNPTYTGITPQFWQSCNAVCGPEEWSVWGFPTCGKGHPSQSGQVGHGTAPARFRGVKVGSGS